MATTRGVKNGRARVAARFGARGRYSFSTSTVPFMPSAACGSHWK